MAARGDGVIERSALAASPVHRAVWDRDVPVELFDSVAPDLSGPSREIVDASLSAIRRRISDATVYDAAGIVGDRMVADLAGSGFWGLRVERGYGGSGLSFAAYMHVLTRLVALDPWVGVLASMQAGLGPVTTLNAFATMEQKQRLLPPLASGERLGVYATTEPGTSSDLRAVRTTATRAGDTLRLTGEKLLITNVAPGRTASVLCQVDGEPRMVMVELPDHEDERFGTVTYGLRAFRHVHNRGLLFNQLPVPADNLLNGPGLAIAYHALNHGRVAICAGTAGLLRRITGSLVPWVQTRETFGAAIATRELVQRRLGRLAARIVGADAVAGWSAQLLDEGYRGELEAVLAKVFGSEILKEATVDLLLKTHGGRALLDGNMFADDVYDLLAPTVYEGENEILTLGFFRALAKEHSVRLLAPIAAQVGPRPGLRRMWQARSSLAPYAIWLADRHLRTALPRSALRRELPLDPDDQTELALQLLKHSGLEISRTLRRHGEAVNDRQAESLDLAQRVQTATAMLVVSRYGSRHDDPLVRAAAACMAAELAQRLTGLRLPARYQRHVTVVGAAVADDEFAPVTDAPHSAPIMPRHLLIP